MSKPTRWAQQQPIEDQHSATETVERRAPNGSTWTRPDYSNWIPRLRVVDDGDVPHHNGRVDAPEGEPEISLPVGHDVVACRRRHAVIRARGKWGIELSPVPPMVA